MDEGGYRLTEKINPKAVYQWGCWMTWVKHGVVQPTFRNSSKFAVESSSLALSKPILVAPLRHPEQILKLWWLISLQNRKWDRNTSSPQNGSPVVSIILHELRITLKNSHKMFRSYPFFNSAFKRLFLSATRRGC